VAEETDLIGSWLTPLLAADTAGAGSLGVLSAGITSRIYDTLAPQEEETYPIIIFNIQSATDLMTISRAGSRVWANCLVQVKVIGKDQAFSELTGIASRIDALIHQASGAPIGGTIVACTREQIVRYIEPVGALVYRHLGGLFRMLAQAA